MNANRIVRPNHRFWISVATAFPHERGPHGQPSRDDFKQTDYLDICHLIRVNWEQLPLWQGQRTDYRQQDHVGIFGIYSVTGQLERDGSITLVEILIQTFDIRND